MLTYLVALFTAASLIPDVDDHPTRLAVALWTGTFVIIFILVPVLTGGATPGRALLGSASEPWQASVRRGGAT